MMTKICLLIALFSLSIFSSLSHGSRLPTSNPNTALHDRSIAATTADYYYAPWVPPNWFYNFFPPQIADMIRKQVSAMTAWMRQFQPPYGGSYPQPQPPPVQQPKTPPTQTMPPPVQQQPGTPPPSKCSSVTRVIDTCAHKHTYTVNDGYSWSCTFNDNCCKAALSVSDDCLNMDPMISTIRNICCPHA